MDRLRHEGTPPPLGRTSPRQRKPGPTLCSHCSALFPGSGPHLIRLLHDAGWRVRFQDGQAPSLLLCPDCQST